MNTVWTTGTFRDFEEIRTLDQVEVEHNNKQRQQTDNKIKKKKKKREKEIKWAISRRKDIHRIADLGEKVPRTF